MLTVLSYLFLVFSSKMKDMDHQGEMNEDNFLHWFEYQLLVNLEESSVMDNVSYHSTILDKVIQETN